MYYGAITWALDLHKNREGRYTTPLISKIKNQLWASQFIGQADLWRGGVGVGSGGVLLFQMGAGD